MYPGTQTDISWLEKENDKITQTCKSETKDTASQTENVSGAEEEQANKKELKEEARQRFCDGCGRRTKYYRECERCHKAWYCSTTCQANQQIQHQPHCL